MKEKKNNLRRSQQGGGRGVGGRCEHAHRFNVFCPISLSLTVYALERLKDSVGMSSLNQSITYMALATSDKSATYI